MQLFTLPFAAASLALAGLGHLTFCAMRRPDIPHAVLERRYADPRSSFFDMPDGVRIHYHDQGEPDGQPIFLVHGYCASLHTWEPWIAHLRTRYRLISLDLPGHGLTRTPWGYRIAKTTFAAVLDAAAGHLRLQSFALVGSSMGGALAWDYARRNPERVDALVLIGAAGWTPKPGQDVLSPGTSQLLRSPMGPWLRDLDNTSFMRMGLRASFANPDLAVETMVSRYHELGRAPMNRRLQMQIALDEDLRYYADRTALAEIRAPTLVLHGAEDKLVPAGDGIRFATAIRDARLVLYNDVGHIVHEEIPERSASDLHGFLQEATAERTRAPRKSATRQRVKSRMRRRYSLAA
jgi:pimeloyl-ACP methyl ester carboxylesterase